MNKNLTKLKLKRYLCPYCGEWHTCQMEELRSYDSNYPAVFTPHYACDKYEFYLSNNKLYYLISSPCSHANNIIGHIDISDISVHPDEPIVTFKTSRVHTHGIVNHSTCIGCDFFDQCNFRRSTYSDGDEIQIQLGFEFDEDDYYKIVNPALLSREKEPEEDKDTVEIKDLELENFNQKKEDSNMDKTTITTKTSSLWNQLYKHSPEENVEILKEWANKYKPTLKWAIPVISIYAAYRILNSKNSNLNINNIFEQSEKELGFGFESLKDKKTLKKLLILGGTTAGAYAAIKAVSSIYVSTDNKEQLSVENIEQTMDSLDSTSKKFAWIQPQIEAMLPVAVSVIIVYLMTQKPKWFEKLKDKINNLGDNISAAAEVYLGLAKSFISNTLNIASGDQEESKNFKKFALLTGIVGILVFLYGKGILQKDDEENKSNEKVKEFISQISSIMKKLMPTAFAGLTTFLVTKHVINDPEDSEVGILEIPDSEESQNNTFEEDDDDDDESESESELK